MSDLSNPNGNSRPQRKCTKPKRIFEDFVMTKISNPPRKVKRRRKLNKPLVHVDIASHESEIPSNLSVTQPNNSDNNCEEIIELSSDDEDNNDIIEQAKIFSNLNHKNLNEFQYIETSHNNRIFPGYNQKVFLELKNFLSNKNFNDLISEVNKNRVNELFRIYLPGAWLNDVIVQQYFEILKKNCNKDVFVFDSFFFDSIHFLGFDGFIKRFMNDINLLTYSKVIVPTFVKDHWILLVAELDKFRILYYDSLNYFNIIYPKIKLLMNFLNEEFIQKEFYNLKLKSLITDVYSAESPKQENTYDCGVFTCTNARYCMFNKPSNFTQNDVPLLRHRILYEIIHSKLLPTE